MARCYYNDTPVHPHWTISLRRPTDWPSPVLSQATTSMKWSTIDSNCIMLCVESNWGASIEKKLSGTVEKIITASASVSASPSFKSNSHSVFLTIQERSKLWSMLYDSFFLTNEGHAVSHYKKYRWKRAGGRRLLISFVPMNRTKSPSFTAPAVGAYCCSGDSIVFNFRIRRGLSRYERRVWLTTLVVRKREPLCNARLSK